MSIPERLLNISMLRGCKYRVTAPDHQDTVVVPVYVPLRGRYNEREEITVAEEMTRQRLTISKPCAVAYLNLHAQVTEMKDELKRISELSRKLLTCSIHELQSISNSIDATAYGLNDTLHRFLEDEAQANRKDISC